MCGATAGDTCCRSSWPACLSHCLWGLFHVPGYPTPREVAAGDTRSKGTHGRKPETGDFPSCRGKRKKGQPRLGRAPLPAPPYPSFPLQLIDVTVRDKRSMLVGALALCSFLQGRAVRRLYGDAGAGRLFQLPSRLRGDPADGAVLDADSVHGPGVLCHSHVLVSLSSILLYLPRR